jgi:hypothetical protein
MLKHRPVGRSDRPDHREPRADESKRRGGWHRRPGSSGKRRAYRPAQEERCPAIVIFMIRVGMDAFVKLG